MSDQHPLRTFSQVLLGRPIETSRASHEELGKVPALAVFASDALSSVAYATEEILVVLAVAGTAYLGLSLPIAVAIGFLLIVVSISYRQTIFAYPNGGGAYVVAKDNLGEGAAQIAAAALMTDYVLTVAVSVSSGVAQIASGLPILGPYRVQIAVALILLVMLVNLRGARESSSVLAVPTYTFLLIAAFTLGAGLVQWAGGALGTVQGVESSVPAIGSLNLFLILRAFSSGSTALTGVEAISNGITAFKEPRSRNAATTLATMSVILLSLFLGYTFLANQVHALPSHEETVISQIARTVFGPGPLYGLMLVATATILIVAANTAFAGFPRLAAMAAGDGNLPRQLTIRGSRLVFSWGITLLALIACILVIIFGASVTALIPLYAVGVFLSFTLSQLGMVRRWNRLRKKAAPESSETGTRYWSRLLINAVGSVTTAAVTVIFAVSKFLAGAWLIVVVVPALTAAFARIRRHYREVATELRLVAENRSVHERPVRTLVLIDRLHAASLRTINFVESTGRAWTAVHVSTDDEPTEELQARWVERFPDRELVVLPSPFRSLTEPLMDYIQSVRDQDPMSYINVVIGELVMETFWEQGLHHNSALILELALRHVDGIAVTIVPFHLHHVQDDVAEELPGTDGNPSSG